MRQKGKDHNSCNHICVQIVNRLYYNGQVSVEYVESIMDMRIMSILVSLMDEGKIKRGRNKYYKISHPGSIQV